MTTEAERQAAVSASVIGAIVVVALGAILIAARNGAPAGCYPEPIDIVAASLFALIACIGGAFAVQLAWRGRNWVHLVTVAGCAVFVAGLAGQRAAVGSQSTEMAKYCAVIPGSTPTAWSDTIQVASFHISPVIVAGILVVICGVVLGLLLERVGPNDRNPIILGPLAEDDTV